MSEMHHRSVGRAEGRPQREDALRQSDQFPALFAGPQDASAVEASVTQDELAGAANLSRNSVGVMLRRLERRGLIRVEYGRMIVLAPRVLRAFGDQG